MQIPKCMSSSVIGDFASVTESIFLGCVYASVEHPCPSNTVILIATDLNGHGKLLVNYESATAINGRESFDAAPNVQTFGLYLSLRRARTEGLPGE